MSDLIARAADNIAAARFVVALTGAGISVESGIPPFRGKGGLWERIDPMEYGHIDAFEADPGLIWRMLIKEMKEIMDRAEPNDGHKGLARLESLGRMKTVITQNVDGLHQRAGSRDVIEFHGNCAFQRCSACGGKRASRDVPLDVLPPQCGCGGVLRPDWVFFGESIPPLALQRSQQAAGQCDVMLVIGTSAEVTPAAYMPVIARRSEAMVIEINPESTSLTRQISDYLIRGPAGAVMRGLVAAVETRL